MMSTRQNQQRMRRVVLVSLFIGSTLLGANAVAIADEEPLTWQRDDTAVSLRRGPDVVWQFNFNPGQSKPYFHPVNLPGLGTLTWEAPPDHPWHHGIWFSWKLINGVNYWEESRKTGQSDGRTSWRKVDVRLEEDHSARIEFDLTYHPAEKPVVMKERRLIEVSSPAADGGYQIDWTATFTAGDTDVLLDRTPLPHEPNGQSFGGYAGLSVRLAKIAADFTVVDSEQQAREVAQRLRFKARAVDYAGQIQEHAGGIAILDHPRNLNAPSPWYVIRNTQTPMTYFSPAVVHDGPHRLAAHDSLTLRYRILIHPGRLDTAGLLRQYERFVEASAR